MTHHPAPTALPPPASGVFIPRPRHNPLRRTPTVAAAALHPATRCAYRGNLAELGALGEGLGGEGGGRGERGGGDGLRATDVAWVLPLPPSVTLRGARCGPWFGERAGTGGCLVKAMP